MVLYFLFYADPDMTNFAKQAGLREIRIDVRGKDGNAIANGILAKLTDES